MANVKQKITPFLWFDKSCEEAMNFYVEVFNGSPHKAGQSKVVSIKRYEKGMETPGMPDMEGKVLTGVFELAGQKFMALDGGAYFKFTEATSFYVACEDQEEIDYFFEKLSSVPESEQCGWLKDKFGLSWQIIPKQLEEMTNDPKRGKDVMNALLKMKKIDIAELEKAAEG